LTVGEFDYLCKQLDEHQRQMKQAASGKDV